MYYISNIFHMLKKLLLLETFKNSNLKFLFFNIRYLNYVYYKKYYY
jgi:hypothetical protein